MSERERNASENTVPGGVAAGGEGLDGARASAERLLRAADDAIARALSGDSVRYLEATRQSSGQ